MRIISGTHKGRRLVAPKKLPVRPTTDRSKEGLFNILQHKYDLKNTSVLDLFSGTGSISYEFGSRGVNNITAVDQNKNCIDFIRMTSESLKLKIQVTQMDTMKYLSSVKTQFDIIFADPPYNLGFLQYIEVIDAIFDKHILKRRGILIIEHSDQIDFEKHSWFSQSRRYGSNVFSFFEE